MGSSPINAYMSNNNNTNSFSVKIFNYDSWNTILLSGPLGAKKLNYLSKYQVNFVDGKFIVPSNPTLSSTLNNLHVSLTRGYTDHLNLVGVGFKWELDKERNMILLHIGFTHVVELSIPSGIIVEILNPTCIKFTGSSKFQVRNFINKIKQIKPSYKDKYKNKGIL